MPSSRSRLWMIGAGALVFSAASGLAAEQWALAGVDPFYFSAADAQAPLAEPRSEPLPTPTPEPVIASYAAYPPVAPAPRSDRAERATMTIVDPWQRKLDAEDRRWEARADAELRQAQHEASISQAAADRLSVGADGDGSVLEPEAGSADADQPGSTRT